MRPSRKGLTAGTDPLTPYHLGALCIGHEAISSRTGCQAVWRRNKAGVSWDPHSCVCVWEVKILPSVVSRGDLTPGKAPHCLQVWTVSEPPQGDG